MAGEIELLTPEELDFIVGHNAAGVARKQQARTILRDPTAVTPVAPTLDLRFGSFDGAPFDDFFARSGAGGYRMNAKGVLVPTVDREPVIDFSGGQPLGAGFYGAYTNLALRSEEFDNASWAKSEVTVTANAVAAPDGNTTADKMVETSATGIHFMQQGATISSGATVTVSWFVKAAERSALQIRMSGTGGTANVGVNLTTGTLTTPTNTGPFSGVTASIEALANSWYRVSLTAITTGITFVNFPLILGAISADNYLGDGTSGLYAWGAQLTATAFPVPYVPTTSAVVARAADSMAISGADFTDFFNPIEGTIFVDFNTPYITTGAGVAINFSDNTYNNRYALYYDGFAIRIIVPSAGVTQASFINALGRGVNCRSAFTYKINNFLLSVNGAIALTDVSGVLPVGISRVDIGSDHIVSSSLNEHIRRLTYWPKALSAAQLERMTA